MNEIVWNSVNWAHDWLLKGATLFVKIGVLGPDFSAFRLVCLALHFILSWAYSLNVLVSEYPLPSIGIIIRRWPFCPYVLSVYALGLCKTFVHIGTNLLGLQLDWYWLYRSLGMLLNLQRYIQGYIAHNIVSGGSFPEVLLYRKTRWRGVLINGQIYTSTFTCIVCLSRVWSLTFISRVGSY